MSSDLYLFSEGLTTWPDDVHPEDLGELNSEGRKGGVEDKEQGEVGVLKV